MAKRKRVLFKSKERRKTASVAAFLRELADKLESGEVVLERGTEDVTLDVSNWVSFKAKVKEKRKHRRTKQTLTLKMQWTEGHEAESKVKVK